jgi:outer membrane receptor protein involved in Fe transport
MRTVKLLSFIYLFIFLASTLVAQQKVTLSGIVVDKDNGSPMQFVNVVVLDAADSSIVTGSLTDDSGAFRLQGVSRGSYIMRYKFIGYQELFSRIEITGNEKNVELGVIEIFPSSLTTNDVVIEVERPLMETSIDKRVYNVNEDLSSKGGTAEDVLQNVPSVEVDQDGNISLRGNSNVIILIDGRPSTLSGSSRSAILNTIPAESIERIEIVTNPSAKYDPDGMTGIINIVLKKNKLRGLNGNLSVTRGTGNSNTASFGVNYRTSKVNLYMNYSHRNTESYRNFYSNRTRQLADDVEQFDQVRMGRDLNTGNTLKTGIDLTLAEGKIWGVSATYGNSTRGRSGLLENIMTTNADGTRLWYRYADENTVSQSIDVNTNYQWLFKEKRGDLMFDLNYSHSNGRMNGAYDEFGFTIFDEGLYFTERLNNPENGSVLTASLDIVRRFPDNMQLEYGLKAIVNSNDRTQYREIYDFDFARFFPDLGINNEFRLVEQIYSAYGIFAQKLQKVHYQVGLRLEQAFVRPELLTTNEKFKNDYFSFFPSVHIVFPMEKNRDAFISYSRRINRPSMYSLNPFVEFTDPFNIRFGNPALRPEYTNSFELGYNAEIKKVSLNNTIYYRHSTDVLQRIVLFDDQGRGAVTYDNLDQTINWGYEGVAVYKVNKWWRNMFSVNVYQLYLITTNPLLTNNSGINWNAKLTSTFDLWNKSASIQINARYNAPRVVPQGFFISGPSLDVSFQKSLLDRKLDLTIRVSDVFDWQQFYIETNVPNVFQQRTFKWESRRLFLTLSYNFGKLQVGKETRKRPAGSGGSGGEDMM